MAVTVVEVVTGGSSPVETTVLSQSAVDVVKPGGTVANIQFGHGLPENPYEGMIWIDLS